jgi:hypothetical protein
VSSIPEALPTPRHTIRRTDINSKPIVDKRATMEILVAVLVGWLVLTLVGALEHRVSRSSPPINAIYARPN